MKQAPTDGRGWEGKETRKSFVAMTIDEWLLSLALIERVGSEEM